MTAGPVSVVIAARDEEQVIERCISGLLRGADAGELEVVVVVNGSTDATAERAEAFGAPVRVLRTSRASKTAAFNAGDAVATSFPRFYVDADVELGIADLRAVADVLRAGPALAAAPRVEVDLSASSWAVRCYFTIWSQLPYVVDNLIGSGVFALSAEGRRRFGRFPDILADDRFVHALFASGERVSVASARFVVHAPRTARDLVRRKGRVFRGNEQHRALYGRPPGAPRWPRWPVVLRRRPRLVVEVAVFVAISVGARARALWKIVRGDLTWDRDDSSRRMAAAPPRPPSARRAGAPPRPGGAAGHERGPFVSRR